MMASALYRLLSVACLGLYAVQQCCAVEQSELTMTHCLRNCSHLTRHLIERKLNVKISSRQSCYEECLKKIGKHDILGNQHIKPLFQRTKRDASNIEANLKQYSESKEAANWTGYRILYADQNWSISCKDVEKNVTSISVSHDWVIGEKARFQVVSLPLVKIDKSGGYQPYRVTLSAVTTDETSSPSITDNPTTSSIADGPKTSSIKDKTNPPSITDNPTTSSIAVSFAKITNKSDNPTTSSIADETNVPSITGNIIIPTASVTIIIVVVVVVVLVYWHFRHSKMPPPEADVEMDVTHCKMPPPEADVEFDAFIIYSSKDEEWVVNTLLPTVEEKHGLKCCIHYRDFKAGKAYRQNMVDSVYKSRKTVAVVSRSFFNSKYCNSEMDMALGRLLERGDDCVVVIKLDDVEREKLPKALKERSYIDYLKSTEKKTWEKKLVDSLTVPVRGASKANFV